MFSWFRRSPKDLVLPEDSRQIETPIEGSNERVISDLFPVTLLTSSFPIVGTTTYAGMAPLAQVKPDGVTLSDFDSYVLRKIERSPLGRFCRCSFTRGITNPFDTAPFYIEEEYDPDFWWDPILYKVVFLIDAANPIVTRGPGGIEIYTNRYVPRAYYTDDQRGALIVKEYFASDVPFTGVGDYDKPKPTTVQYEYANCKDTFRANLHGKLVFDTKQTAIIGYDAAAATAVSISGSISGQIFEATNFEEWETHPFKFESVQKGLLYEGIRYTAIAPDIPEISLL